MDFTEIANAFVNHYYPTFDSGINVRANLNSLYRPESMLTWEKSQFQGTQNIIDALLKPELGTVKHLINATDAQPSVGGAVLVLVTGNLAIDNAFDKPLLFSETFILQPIPGQPGGFFIYNQIFRLVL